MPTISELNEKQTQFPKTPKIQPQNPQKDDQFDDDDDLVADDDADSENI